MSLYDIVDQVEKNASSEEASEQDFTDEEIKEAYAAGRIAGAAYADELSKLSQQAKRQEMGVADNRNEGAARSSENQKGDPVVDDKEENINKQKKEVKDTNNNAGAGSAENSQESDGPKQNSPEDNKDHSVEAAANRVIEALEN